MIIIIFLRVSKVSNQRLLEFIFVHHKSIAQTSWSGLGVS